MQEPLLSVKQVAHRLALSESSVRSMLASGLIPYTRVGRSGGRRRVSESDLAEYLSRGKESPVKQTSKPVRALVKAKPRASYAVLERFGLRV